MQVNANVNAANFLMMGNQAPEKDTAKSGGGMDFASFLQKPSADRDSVVNPAAGRAEKKQQDGKQADVSTSKPDQKSKPVSKASDADKVTEQKAVTKNDVQGKEIAVKSDGQEITEEDAAKLQELVGNLFQLLLEPLELSPEELLNTLEDIGMELTDLLSSDGLKELFLNVKMADPMELVVNEDLNGELKDLLGEWNDLLKESGITSEEACELVSDEDMNAVLDSFRVDETIPDEGKDRMRFREHDRKAVMDELKQSPEETVDSKVQVSREPDTKTGQNASDTGSGDQPFAKERSYRPGEERFVDPIAEAVKEAVDQIEIPELNGQQTVRGSEVVDQIVTQIKVNMNRAATSMELQLYPEHLGRIQINVVSKDGVMTARIVAESEAARQAIEGGLASLKEAMEGQDLKVEAIEVMVSTAGFEKGSEEQRSFEQDGARKGRRGTQFTERNEEPSDEDADLLIMQQTGSSVSYTA